MLNRRRARRGFGVAPVLYVLGLIGVVAGTLFSNYSQSFKTNVQTTNVFSVRNDLDAAAATLAATSKLNNDGTVLCPPNVEGASDISPALTDCPASLPLSLAAVPGGTDAHLPTTETGTDVASYVSSSGAPKNVGILKAAAGIKQLDPWGHYYIVCRWDSPAISADPAFQIVSGGPQGIINTKCGDAPTAASGNYSKLVNAADAVNRASVWQVTAVGTTTQASYSATGVSVDSVGNLTVPGNLNLTGGVGTSVTLTNANLTLTNGKLTLSNGALDGTSGSFAGPVSTGALSSSSGTFSGALSAGGGGFSVDASGALTATGSAAFGAVSAASAAVSGALSAGTVTAGATTLGALTASSAKIDGDLTAIGTTTLSSVKTASLSNAGTLSTGNVAVAGDLSVSGTYGGINATSIANTGTLASGDTTITGDLTVTGTINGTANANLTTATGTLDLATKVTGVLPVGNGGTGAPSADGALNVLFGAAGSGTALPAARLPVVFSTAPGGTYNRVSVDQYGRVYDVSNASSNVGSFDGACGAANGKNGLTNAPNKTNMCESGVVGELQGNGSGKPGWTWTCIGIGAGTTATCTADAGNINGVCNALVNNQVLATTPDTSDATTLCTSGTLNAFTENSNATAWSWTCVGAGGCGEQCSTVSCQAYEQGKCNPNINNGAVASQSVITNGGCSHGYVSGLTLSGTVYTWNCVGGGGSAAATCTATQATNGACGAAAGTIVTSMPSNAALCSAGTPSAINGTAGATRISWTCNGVAGGTQAACSAYGPAAAFAFTNVTGATPSATVASNAVTLSGEFDSASASCSGCSDMLINGASVGTAATGVKPGDTIAIKVTAASSSMTPVTATATVGTTTSSTWTVTTLGGKPNSFSFTDQTGILPGTTVQSDTVTLAGSFSNLGATCTATNSGCLLSQNGGSWVSSISSGINPGDTIAVRQASTSTASGGVTTTATVSVGSSVGGYTTSSTWSVTTGAFTGSTGTKASNVITLGGIFSGLTASCTNCYVSINGGAFASSVSEASTGSTIQLILSPPSTGSTVTATVTLGSHSMTWAILSTAYTQLVSTTCYTTVTSYLTETNPYGTDIQVNYGMIGGGGGGGNPNYGGGGGGGSSLLMYGTSVVYAAGGKGGNALTSSYASSVASSASGSFTYGSSSALTVIVGGGGGAGTYSGAGGGGSGYYGGGGGGASSVSYVNGGDGGSNVGGNGGTSGQYTGGNGSQYAGGAGGYSGATGGTGILGGSAASRGAGGGGYGSGGGGGNANYSSAGGNGGSNGANGISSSGSGGVGANTWSSLTSLSPAAGASSSAYVGGNAGLVILNYISPTGVCLL